MLDDFLHQVIFVQTRIHTDEKGRKMSKIIEIFCILLRKQLAQTLMGIHRVSYTNLTSLFFFPDITLEDKNENL